MYGGGDSSIDDQMRKKVNDIVGSRMSNGIDSIKRSAESNRERLMMFLPVLKIGFLIFFVMILTPEIKKLVEFFDLSDAHATIYIQWLTVILILWTFLPAKKSIL